MNPIDSKEIARAIEWLEILSEMAGWKVDREPMTADGLPIENGVAVIFNEPVSMERAYAFDQVMDGLVQYSDHDVHTVWVTADRDLAFPEPAHSVLLTWT